MGLLSIGVDELTAWQTVTLWWLLFTFSVALAFSCAVSRVPMWSCTHDPRHGP